MIQTILFILFMFVVYSMVHEAMHMLVAMAYGYKAKFNMKNYLVTNVRVKGAKPEHMLRIVLAPWVLGLIITGVYAYTKIWVLLVFSCYYLLDLIANFVAYKKGLRPNDFYVIRELLIRKYKKN